MKKIFNLTILFVLCLNLTGCYFGMNESWREISKGYYLMGWDDTNWKIVYNKDGKPDYFEGVVVDMTVFADGHNDDFIIAKQHPQHADSLKPNRDITNYFIIDLRSPDNGSKTYSFDNEKDFNDKRLKLGVPKDLNFEFTDKRFE